MIHTACLAALAICSALAITVANPIRVHAGGEEPAGGIELTFARLGRVLLVAIEDRSASPPDVELLLNTASGEPVYRLPGPSDAQGLAFWRLVDAVAYDLNDDDREDLVVVIEYLSGIGPTGADPFPLAVVYLQQPSGGFERSRGLERMANEAPLYGTWSGAAQVASALHATGR